LLEPTITSQAIGINNHPSGTQALARQRGLQDALLGVGVDAGEGRVQQEQPPLAQQRARQADPLLLPAGQIDAALADERLPAGWESLDLVQHGGVPRGAVALLVARGGLAEA
jgi:hypothetical protein